MTDTLSGVTIHAVGTGAAGILSAVEAAGLPDGWSIYRGVEPTADDAAGRAVLVLRESDEDERPHSADAAAKWLAAGAVEARERCVGWGWADGDHSTEDIAALWTAAEPARPQTPSYVRGGRADVGGGLSLDIRPNGRIGTATVTAKLGGDTLACESLNLTKSRQRDDYVNSLCDGRAGIDAEAVRQELIKAAADLVSRGDGDGSAQPEADAAEVDLSRIVRPERFILPEVSGLAIPSMMPMGDSVSGRWLMYLRWGDGKRERRPLGPTLDLPDGRRVWIHPEPAEPTPTMRPGWSASARQQWLDGAPAPNAADLFRRLAERVAYFVDLPQERAPGIVATLVCWSMLTYCYHAWPAVPYLYVGGPLGSGKSRVFEILSRLVFRPLPSSNLTAAALFRTLHARGGCLLLDEAERLKQSRDPDVAEILSMLLAGYKAGGSAIRLEPVGDSFRPVQFDVYGPKALACIAGLPPALASRAIPITMFRAAPGSPKPKHRIDGDPAGWQWLRDDMHALALEHGPEWLALADRQDVVPDGLSGRDYELWLPLLAIGAFIEAAGMPGLLELMQGHAMDVAATGKDDQVADADETLLRLLAGRRANNDWPQAKDLLDDAREAEPETFKRWKAKGVANALRRYGVTTNTYAGRKVYGKVSLEQLAKIQAVYGMSLGLQDTQRPTPE